MNSSFEQSRVQLHRYVFAFLLVVAFGAGVLLGNHAPRTASAQDVQTDTATSTGVVENKNTIGRTLPSKVDFQQFWDVWQKIQNKSVKRPVDDVQLYYGAVGGLVASLGDPYSVYFPPDIAKEFQDQLAGSFSGIGAEVGAKDGNVVVVSPLPDTPAERAGLKTGDIVAAIDGTSTLNTAVDEAVKMIRGQKGTKVTLTIIRAGSKDPLTFTMVRDTIEVKSVKTEQLDNSVMDITISSFDEQTQKLFANAVLEAKMAHAKGIVLDLRNDPGGFFDSAIMVASEFLADNQVVVAERDSTQVGTKNRKEFVTEGTHGLLGIPTAVLINGGSASASEIVAGALQDHKVATLIGEKSFGKGSVQEYEQLADGSALKLTVALWFTPDDHTINQTGIQPDVVIVPPKVDPKKVALPVDPLKAKDWRTDPFIMKAMEILKTKIK